MLMEHLPAEVYHGEEHVEDFQQAIEQQVTALHKSRDEVFRQARILTADGWGLTLWEKAYGLEPAPERDASWRRARILAKLRGSATITKEVIARMAEGIAEKGAKVTEFPDEYRFEISFDGYIGVPENIQALALAVEEVKPAHLAYAFVYLWAWYRRLQPYRYLQFEEKTWAQVRAGWLPEQ